MSLFQPPPTYADVVVEDAISKKPRFNPIWLKWFLDLVSVLNGAGGTGINHNDLNGLQGGQTNEFYHLTANEGAEVVGLDLGMSGTGLAARIAAQTWIARTLQAPAAGFTITNPGGVANDPTFVLANDLAALEGLASTGIAVRSAADTWVQRTITAGSGVSVSNGSGAGGNPTITAKHYSLFDHFADAANGGTVETDLYSDTTAAGQFATNGDKIEAQYAGTFAGAVTSTQQIKIYFAGTAIFDSGALGIGATTPSWDAFVTIIRESASIVRCSVSYTSGFATLTATSTYTKLTGLTLANTNILKITGTAGGAAGASNQIIASEGHVDFKAAA